MAAQYIGSQISLISKSDIRYVGILNAISPEEATISLERVRSMGSEGRKPPQAFIAPSETVYDFIVFKASDIRDLTIEGPAQADAPQQPVPDDPAIVNSRRPPDNASAPYGFVPPQQQQSPFYPPPPPQHHAMHMPPPQGYGMPSPYGMPGQPFQQGSPFGRPSGSFPPQPHQQASHPLPTIPQQPPPTASQPNNITNDQPVSTPAQEKRSEQAQNLPAPIPRQNVQLTSSSDTLQPAKTGVPTGPRNMSPNHAPRSPDDTKPASQQKAIPQEPTKPTSASKQQPLRETPKIQEQPKANGGPPSSFADAAGRSSAQTGVSNRPPQKASTPGQSAALPGQSSITATQVEQLAADMNKMRPPSNASRGGRGSSRPQASNRRPSNQAQPTPGDKLPEFDFAASNAKFEVVSKPEEKQAADTFYKKSSSFFDTISSEASEGPNRVNRQEESKKNVDTFGEDARGMRGGSRGGRGFRGRGRGRGRALRGIISALTH